MMAAAAGRRPAAGEGVEHAEPERGPGRGRDVIAPGRAIERRMDGATKGQIDELVTAAGAVVGRLADGGAAGSAGLVGGPVAGGKVGLTGRKVVGSGLLLVVVGVAFAVLLVSVAELRTATRLARHSQEVLVAANQLERLAIDLETGQRGFVITGQERFLGPWRAARVAVPGQASTLARLVAGDPAQQRRAQRLRRAVRSYVEDYSVGLVAAARRDPAAARTVAATQEGKRRVDAMRGEFDRLIGTEQGLAVARQQRAQGAARRAIGAAAGGLAGSVLLIVGLAGYLTRAIVRPVRSTAAMAGRLAGGDLGARMPQRRAGEIGGLQRSFNTMAGSLQASRAELGRLADEQAALRRVATLVARGVPAAEVSPPWPRRPAGCWAPTPRTCCATSTTPPSPWSPAGAATARPCRSGRAPPSRRRPCRPRCCGPASPPAPTATPTILAPSAPGPASSASARRWPARSPCRGGCGAPPRSAPRSPSRCPPAPRPASPTSPSWPPPPSPTPRPAPSWPPPEHESSRPPTRPAGGSSATCTTASSSGWCRWRWTCAPPRPACQPSSASSTRSWTGSPTGSARRWRSCARPPVASTRQPCHRAGSAPRSRSSPDAAPSPSKPTSSSRPAYRSRSRSPPTTWSPRRSPTPPNTPTPPSPTSPSRHTATACTCRSLTTASAGPTRPAAPGWSGSATASKPWAAPSPSTAPPARAPRYRSPCPLT